MKNGGAMDGAFSQSPQTARDAASKAENLAPPPPAEDQTTPRQSGGLWNSRAH